MAGSSGFSITIAAVDKTTSTLDRINSKIAGAQSAINRRLETANAPMKRLQTQLGRTVNLLGGGKLYRGVADLSTGFEKLTRSSFGAFDNVSRLVDPLRIITGAATIAGLAALEERFASLGQRLTNTGRLMNVDPARLAQWEGATRLAGGTAADADSSLRGTEYAMNDAQFGMNNVASGYLSQAIGPDWQTQHLTLDKTTMALTRFIAGLKGAQRANALRNISGAFGWTDGFTSMVAQGPAAIQKYLTEAKAHGSPTDAQIGQGDSLAQSLNAAQQSVEGIATAISSKLAGPLQKIIDSFTKWTDGNRTLIAQKVGDVISGIATKISQINLKPLEAVFEKINSIVQSIGGWQTAITAVIGVLVASKVASIALPFVQLSSAIAGLSSGPGSFGALGRALTAAGFAVAGGQIVQLAAKAAGAGSGAATVLGDATTGAIAGGAIFGPVGAGIGGALGAAYGGYEAHKATKEQQAARADDMVSYYRSQGLSAVQAAALVGGFQQESSLDPTATNGQHYGIGQWDPSRQADFKRQFGHDIQQSTLQEQMQFSLREMFDGKEGDAGRRLLAAKTAPEATDAALHYERPADPGTPAWQNEQAWRLANTAAILARQKDGGKYLPQIDPEGNVGAFPTDNEPTRLLGVPAAGTGMDREDRAAPEPSQKPAAVSPHAGEYQSALTGQWERLPNPASRSSGSTTEDRLAVDLTIHDNRRIEAKVQHSKKPTTTNVRVMSPMPSGVS